MPLRTLPLSSRWRYDESAMIFLPKGVPQTVRRGVVLLVLGMFANQGCQPPKTRPPMPAPAALFSLDYFQGTVLSGPVAGPASAQLTKVRELQSRMAELSELQRAKTDVDEGYFAFEEKKKKGEPTPQVQRMVQDDPDILQVEDVLESLQLRLSAQDTAGGALVREQCDVWRTRLNDLTNEKIALYTRVCERRLVIQRRLVDDDFSRRTAEIDHLKSEIDSLSVHVTFLALENIPTTPYTPVGARAIFFSSSAAGNAVLPAAQLTRSATIADLGDAVDLPAELRAGKSGRITPMSTLSGVLPPGVTAEFSALDPLALHDLVTGAVAHRGVQLSVTHASDPAAPRQLALALRDLVPLGGGQLDLRIETAIFNLPAGDRTNTALVVPFRFDHSKSQALAILVQISPGSADDAHIAATAQCLTQLSKSAPASQPAISTGQASDRATVAAAEQALAPATGRRSALVYLADQTGASLCEDLAMEADDATLAQLVGKIQSSLSSPGQSDPDVGWVLDHAALQLLARLAIDAANGAKVPTELLAILTNHTGEVGRHPSSLDDVLKGVSSRQQLDNRLVAENMIFLEDSSPASRVRAYDWLSARHLAPPGYDPLAGGKARRDALQKAAGG